MSRAAPSSATPRWRTAVAAVLCALLAVTLAAPALLPAFADDLDDKKREAEERQKEIERDLDELRGDIEDVDADLQEAILELRRIEKQLPAAREQAEAAREDYNVALAEYEAAKREADRMAERLAGAESTENAIVLQIEQDAERAAQAQTSVGQLARQAMRGELSTSSLALMLESSSAEDYVEQYALLNTALRGQSQLIEDLAQVEAANRNLELRLGAVRERIAEYKVAADAAEAKAADTRDKAQRAKIDAENHEATVVTLIASQKAKTEYIEDKKTELEAKEKQLAADRRKVYDEIADLAKKIRERDAKSNPGPSGPVGKGIFTNPSSYSPMYITSKYGWRMHPVLGYPRLHAGLDLRAYCGMSILAGRSGTVVWAKYRSGFGNQVLVDHGLINGNSVMTSYNHLSGFAVSADQGVAGGQTVGYSGSTGTSTACHLHFEVYINGFAVDPLPYL